MSARRILLWQIIDFLENGENEEVVARYLEEQQRRQRRGVRFLWSAGSQVPIRKKNGKVKWWKQSHLIFKRKRDGRLVARSRETGEVLVVWDLP